jgi:hypothetical protein
MYKIMSIESSIGANEGRDLAIERQRQIKQEIEKELNSVEQLIKPLKEKLLELNAFETKNELLVQRREYALKYLQEVESGLKNFREKLQWSVGE